ncbi:MAG: hypothetical protein K0B85_05255, partial [Coriobacteriia bacterium]|nr:hypothetical protein [Coriobacteriia bacterium]
LPSYYPRSAMTTVLRELGEGSQTGLLPVYVQLIMMRKGRIRGTLSSLAEMVVARSVDTTIARYAHHCISEPDPHLPEWSAVEALDVAGLLGRLESEPEAAVAEIFGPPVDVRDDVEGGLPEVMRQSGIRQTHQPADPVEDDDVSEEDAADRLADMVSDGNDLEVQEEIEGETAEEAAAREAAEITTYVIAHAKKHASPVLARGMRAYVESGTAAMSQELKITRAPRKTLGALARFARLTFRSVVIVYDGFETWEEVPEDLRALIVSGLSEVRLALGTNGVIVIAASDKEAPELDDPFANAIRVDWAMPEIEQVQEPEVPYDAELLVTWLRTATIPGSDTSALWQRVEAVCAGSESLAAGAALASDEVEKAAAEAVSR